MTAPMQSPKPTGVDDLLEDIADRSDLYTYGADSLPWSYEETQTPFYNDAEGYSCGGNGTGLCEIYRVDDKGDAIWDEDGEPVYIPVFAVENAKMIVERVNGYDALVAERDALLASHRQDGEALNHFEAENRALREELTNLVDWLEDNKMSIEGEFIMDELLAPARTTLSPPIGTEPAK